MSRLDPELAAIAGVDEELDPELAAIVSGNPPAQTGTMVEGGQRFYPHIGPTRQQARGEYFDPEALRISGELAKFATHLYGGPEFMEEHPVASTAVGMGSLALFMPQTWAAAGGLGARAGVGVWGRPLAEAALGGGAETALSLVRGETLPEALKHGGTVGGVIGAIPGVGPAFRQARAGWGVLGRPISRVAQPVVGGVKRMLRPLKGAAEPAAAGLRRATGAEITPGAKERLRQRRLGERTQELIERSQVSEERAGVDIARARKTVEGLLDTAADVEARASAVIIHPARVARAGIRQELDQFAQRLFDEPAAAMQEVFEKARQQAHGRWIALSKEKRLIPTQQRRVAVGIAQAERDERVLRHAGIRQWKNPVAPRPIGPEEQAAQLKLSGLREEATGLRERLKGVNAELKGLRWARDPKRAQRIFPPEFLPEANAAKTAARDALWAEATERWSPETINLLSETYKTIAPRETALGKLLVRAGLMSENAARRWHDVHLRRIVPFFGGRWDELREFLQKYGPEYLGELERRQAGAARLRGIGRGPLSIPGRIRAPRRVQDAQLPQHMGTELVPFGERVSAGETLAAQASIRAESLATISREMSISADQLGRLSPIGQGKYTELTGRAFGELEGRFVEKPVFDILTDWERTASAGEKVVSFFKAMKVPLSGAVIGHNVITNEVSGVIEYGVRYLDYRNTLAAVRELAGNSGLWKQHQNAYPLASGLFARAEMQVGLRRLSGAGTVRKLYEKLVHWGIERPAEAYGGLELIAKWRGARLDIVAKRAGGAARAMARADRTWINYGRMPGLVRKARRSPIGTPFISFLYGMGTRTIPHWIRRHPGKLWAFFRAPEILSKGFEANERVELEKAVMPEWMTPELMLRLPTELSAIFAKDGASLWIDLSRLTPFAELAQSSVLAFHEMIEDLRTGGPGVGLDALVDFGAGIASPIYRVPMDILQIARGEYPTMTGRKPLEDMTPAGKLRAVAGVLAKTMAPGAAVDFYRILTAEGPSFQEPFKRNKFLEALRSAGLPLVRVRPDLGYYRAIDRWGQVIDGARKAEFSAKTPRQKRYWERVRTRAENKQELLLKYQGAVEELEGMEPLPFDLEKAGVPTGFQTEEVQLDPELAAIAGAK